MLPVSSLLGIQHSLNMVRQTICRSKSAADIQHYLVIKQYTHSVLKSFLTNNYLCISMLAERLFRLNLSSNTFERLNTEGGKEEETECLSGLFRTSILLSRHLGVELTSGVHPASF